MRVDQASSCSTGCGTRTLPEEARLAEHRLRARGRAPSSWRGLASQRDHDGAGVRLALSRSPQEAFFEAAGAWGLRIASGLVRLGPQPAAGAARRRPTRRYAAEPRAPRERWHGRGRLRFAVTPRFSVSCTEGMLEGVWSADARVAQDDAFFTSHINENRSEIEFVAELFPWARDYLDTYERYGLVGCRSVFAHDVHGTDDELGRLAAARGLRRALPVRATRSWPAAFLDCAATTRTPFASPSAPMSGRGQGLSLFKEGLMAYHVQMVRVEGIDLIGPTHLLYLATRAGAEALGLGEEIGDLAPGRSADLGGGAPIPPEGGTLEAVLAPQPVPRGDARRPVHARPRGVRSRGWRGRRARLHPRGQAPRRGAGAIALADCRRRAQPGRTRIAEPFVRTDGRHAVDRAAGPARRDLRRDPDPRRRAGAGSGRRSRCVGSCIGR